MRCVSWDTSNCIWHDGPHINDLQWLLRTKNLGGSSLKVGLQLLTFALFKFCVESVVRAWRTEHRMAKLVRPGVSSVPMTSCLRAYSMQLSLISADWQSTSRPCGLMDKALVFGTKDCRFESCQGHVLLIGAAIQPSLIAHAGPAKQKACHPHRTAKSTADHGLKSKQEARTLDMQACGNC